MAEKAIFGLVALALVVVYMAMHKSLTGPDLRKPPDGARILSVIQEEGHTCDIVDSYRLVDAQNGWALYYAHCHDGQRYVYAQSAIEGKYIAYTCDEEQAKGYMCPK
jgi:hypothetical protein